MQFSVNTVYLAFLLASVSFAYATDNQPCVRGSCFHSGGDNVKTLVHSIALTGSHELISDVTPAAGWNIQGCNSDWSSGSHTVQMACEGTPDQTQHCDHLFTGGAENTIVRLPETCGTGPFARVVSINQTNGVHTMQLDYDFKQIPHKPGGNVSFEITMGDGIPSKTSTALQPRFSESISKEIPLSFSKTVAFYNNTLNCSLGADSDSASLNLAIAGTGAANVTVILAGSVVGSVIPPRVDNASLIATISGTASLSIEAEIDLKLSLGTGQQLVFTEGLPGLDFPGLFELGPSFDLYTSAELILELQASAKITAEWDISSIGITWPTSAAPPTQNTNPKSSNPVHLSVDTAFDALAGVTGHILPTLTFGFNVLDGFAKADALAQADFYLDLTVQIKDEISTSKRDHPRDLEKRGGLEACVQLNAGIGITASLQGSLGPLKAAGSVGPAPFELKLYDQCFGIGPNSARRDFEAFEVVKRGDLQCPDAAASLLQVLV